MGRTLTEIPIITFYEDPLVEMTEDGSIVWVNDKIVWEKEHDEECDCDECNEVRAQTYEEAMRDTYD